MPETVQMLCSACGKACQDGSYYFKDGKATCIHCAVASLSVPEARALSHDAERKKAESVAAAAKREAERQGTPLCEATKLCAELEVEARKVALTFVRQAAKVVEPVISNSATGTDNLGRCTLDAAERFIKMAERLDLMADKLFARRD